MTGGASTSQQTSHQTCEAWKPVIENASRVFVDEQLQREPFCSVSMVEGKLHTLANRLNGIERTLDADSEKITLLEERLRVKADLGHNSDLSTVRSCERHHVDQSNDVSDLLAGFRSQSLLLSDLVEGRDYGEILEEIYKHLESVMSSEPIRRQDQNVLSILEKEVEALRQSPHKGSRRDDLRGELQQALRNVHSRANTAFSARLQPFFETLCGFLAGPRWQVHDILTPLIGAEAQNSLLGRLKQAARRARAGAAHSGRFLSSFSGSFVEGWVGSARVYLTRSWVILGRDAPRFPAHQWFMAILVPVILALSHSVLLSIGVHPTTPSQHVASSGSSLDVSHPPLVPPAPTAESVAITHGDYLEEDFWRSLLEE